MYGKDSVDVDISQLSIFLSCSAIYSLDVDTDYDDIEMVDDGTSMDDHIQEDTSTQTLLTPANIDHTLFSDDDKFKMTREEKEGNLVDVGINTLPKLTFEKETCSPLQLMHLSALVALS
jgi:hypothetical protein